MIVSTCFLTLAFSCREQNQPMNLSCVEYWAEINFANFCGLSMGNFDFNSIPNDICNADQNSSYPFDDLVSIRVFNHFSSDAAKDEYDTEEADALLVGGYTALTDLGDDAYAILNSQFGELDNAIVLVLFDTYTVYVEVNGNAVNGANNCFDESSVIEFARSLVSPL